jgi:hypothetical protein
MRNLKLSFALFLLSASALPQTRQPAPSVPNAVPINVPKYEIVLADADDYPTIPWLPNNKNYIESQCNGDGSVYVWSPAQGLVALTPKGLVPFLRDKIDDIPHPGLTYVSNSASISAAGVYFPASGHTDDDVEVREFDWTDNQGVKHTGKQRFVVNVRLYIAQYDSDGHYRGAISPPVFAKRIAVFDSGTILAQGLDEREIPRVGLLDASGRLLRYLELPKDISATQEPAPDKAKPCDGCESSAWSVSLNSYFVPWQGKILFLRSGVRSTRMYEIRPSGEVHSVQVTLPKGRANSSMIASDTSWFVWSDWDSGGQRSLFEIDPESGKVEREYVVKTPDAKVACFANREFLGVRFDKDAQKLKVVRGTAQPYRPE